MHKNFVVSAVAYVMLATVPVYSAEFFVGPEGDDAAAGTATAPWATIERAVEAATPGDTVTFLDGEYTGVIEPTVSGTAEAPITFRSQNRHGAVLIGGTATSGVRVAVLLAQREWITIEGFAVLPESGGWMRLEDCRYITVRGCRMEGATGSNNPMYVVRSHYCRFQDLQLLRAILLSTFGHVWADMWNNFASSHNLYEDIYISRAGHRPFGLWIDSHHNVVRRCVFDCRWGRNFEFFTAPRTLVEDCVIINGFDGAGSADGRAKLFTVDGIFRRNVIAHNHYGPLVINAYKYGEMEPFGMIGSRLYNNTFYRNHMFGFQMVDMGREPEIHMVRDNILQNNIFAYNDIPGDGLALDLYSNIADDNRFIHNLVFGRQEGDKPIRYDFAFPGITSWEGVRLTGEEANAARPAQFFGNITAEPGFVNPELDDLRLRADSPAVNAGNALTATREAGSGRLVPVVDVRWFYDGFGIPGEIGDLVFVGAQQQQARVERADIENNMLHLDREISWEKGAPVTLPHTGSAPDLGAYEFGAEAEPWFAAPVIPPGLRLETMETATTPLVRTSFERENLEEWFYYWNLTRQTNTQPFMDDTTAASGQRSLRIHATDDGATLSGDIRPRWWDIDRFPWIEVSYRIPPGTPVGLWLYAFPSSAVGRGAVCIGGTSTRTVGPFPDIARYALVDDGQWHSLVMDARLIRQIFPGVNHLFMFRFYTHMNGKKDQHFWFDDFAIYPADMPPDEG